MMQGEATKRRLADAGRHRTLTAVLLGLSLLAGLVAGPAMSLPNDLERSLDPPAFDRAAGSGWSNHNSPAAAPLWGMGGSAVLLVASTWSDGTYQSLDQGSWWTPSPNFPPVTEGTVAFDPTDPDVGYVAGFGGVARTMDSGVTWTLALDVGLAEQIHVGPDGTVLVAVSDDRRRILRSTDRLESVHDLHVPIPPFSSIKGVAFGPTLDQVVVTTFGSTHRTADGGLTWKSADGGGALSRDDDGRIYRASFGTVQRSNDGGATWILVPVPSWVRGLVPGPGARLFATTNAGLLLSADRGDTWTNWGFGDELQTATSLFPDPVDTEAVFVTTEEVGVFHVRGDDGVPVLEGRSTGFPPVDLWGLGASQDGSLLLAGGPLGLFASKDDGQTWAHTGAGLGIVGIWSTAADAAGTRVYAGGQNRVFEPWIQSSADGGRSWQTFRPQLGGDGIVRGLAVHAEEGSRAYAAVWMDIADSHVLETRDGGLTWQSILSLPVKVWDVAWHELENAVLVATEIGVLSLDPDLHTFGPRMVGPDVSRGVDTAAGLAVTGGSGGTVWAGQAPTTPFTPVATSSAQFLDKVAIDPAGSGTAWLTTFAGALVACPITPLETGAACVEDAPPGGEVRDVLVTVDGQTVLVATTSGGLWVRAG